MTLEELYNKLSYQLERGRKDLRVVIKTCNKSIGGSSSVGIRDVSSGFDWDDGTLFIHPERDLVKSDLNRDVPLAPIDFNNELPHLADPTCKKKVFLCRNCEEKISIKDIYCRNCGQRLK